MRFSFAGALLAATLIGIATAAAQAPAASTSEPADRAMIGGEPWCVVIKDTSGSGNPRCEYASLTECNKFLEGRRGLCIINPGHTQARAMAKQMGYRGEGADRAMIGGEPWCTVIRGRSGSGIPRCEYASLTECNRFLEGRSGLCIRNMGPATTGRAR